MKNIANILASFVLGLLLISVVLNVVFIPKAIRKPTVKLQPYEKIRIINQFTDTSKQIEKQHLINHPTLLKIDTSGIAVYSDTIISQDVDIAFTNRVQGVLLSSKLVYNLKTPQYQFVTNQTTIKDQAGRLYGVGSLSSGPGNNFYLGVMYVPGHSHFMAGYLHGFGPGTHQFLIGYKF